jgi:hypothetical protein
LQQNGCGLLGALGVNNEQVSRSIANQGGIQATLSSMTNHPSSSHLQQSGLSVLFSLSSSHSRNVDNIVHWGGILLIIVVMRSHPLIAGVQVNGCAVLGNLAPHIARHRTLFVELGGFGAMVDARDAEWQDAGEKNMVETAFLGSLWQFVRASPNRVQEWAIDGRIENELEQVLDEG